MDIYKALKREKNIHKMFYGFMMMMSLVLPIIVYLLGLNNSFFLIYLLVLEVLIFMAMIEKTNNIKLDYSCNNNKLRFRGGLLSKDSVIFCDKVLLVHTEKMDEEMEIVIVTSVNFRNRGLKPITKSFYKRYPSMVDYYVKVKENNPEEGQLYFQVIKRGGLKKYMLLDIIYRNCVKAVYTADSIQNIKISRGQTLV